MPSYADPDLLVWMSVLAPIRSRTANATSFEAAANAVVHELHERYRETTALARVYAVLPYNLLDPGTRQFVDEVTVRAGQEPLAPQTSVLALAASRGSKPEWCDRRLSIGHRGIPLISEKFVSEIPMVAVLLKELGVEMRWVERTSSVNARLLLANNGVFFVASASEARDAERRLIIPAQDFVAEQCIKSVFGMGSVFKNGVLAVLIIFTRESLTRSRVDRLTPLISLLKSETASLVAEGRIFEPS